MIISYLEENIREIVYDSEKTKKVISGKRRL